MISENYSIDEFVKAVKEKDFIEVITLAVEEATLVDRISRQLKSCSIQHHSSKEDRYLNHLKQLIDYLRYTVTPKGMDDEVFLLYMANWGNA